jgi:hypothetical protein
MCCKVLTVGALHKPMLTWCPQCQIGKGCGIYASRPAECAEFTCLWLLDETMPAELQPNKCKFVTYQHSDGYLVVDCDPQAKGVHLDKKYLPIFTRLASALEPQGGFVAICHGMQVYALTPRAIFYLGKTRGTHAIRTYIDPATKMIGRITAEPLT